MMAMQAWEGGRKEVKEADNLNNDTKHVRISRELHYMVRSELDERRVLLHSRGGLSSPEPGGEWEG